ncbi:hypothetical protein [Marinifilum sp.]|uniref:hypothetical protein n=1 Tax=Marinifilum sp. TaxID=2033137 RepID=UPI003BA95F55
MKKLLLIMCFLLLAELLFSQSLFESSLSSNGGSDFGFRLNGYVRADAYMSEKDYRACYSELSLQFETNKENLGRAYADFRIQKSLLKEDPDQYNLREAYVDLYLGKIDLRVGQQIIVWGRADGFNPTNNLSTNDFAVFSPEEDDRRMSNFILSATYNAYPWRINVNVIPVYKASNIPFPKVNTESISWLANYFPEETLQNSALAFKLSYEEASFDASLSFFRGYHKTTGLDYQIKENHLHLFQRAHLSYVLGADFSTNLGKIGLRGEFALSLNEDKEEEEFYIPEDQLEYTLGVDKEWGNFSLILQYVGKYVPDEVCKASDFSDSRKGFICQQNNLMFGQTDKWIHSVSMRPAMDLAHETLQMEILSLYNFTTQELYCKPMIEYLLTDNISTSIGAQLYFGPSDSRYDYLEHSANAIFLEFKVNF